MDAKTGRSVLIKAAAELARQQFMPSDDPGGYPHRTMSTRKVANMMEAPRNSLLEIAMDVRKGADAQAREIKRLRDGIAHCHQMLLTEADTKAALDRAESILRDLLVQVECAARWLPCWIAARVHDPVARHDEAGSKVGGAIRDAKRSSIRGASDDATTK